MFAMTAIHLLLHYARNDGKCFGLLHYVRNDVSIKCILLKGFRIQ